MKRLHKFEFSLYFSLILMSIATLALTTPEKSEAAACCGGGFNGVSLMTGDDRAQVRASVSSTEIVVDHVDTSGFWRTWEAQQSVQSLQLSGSWLLSDRWQTGFTTQLMQRSYLDQTYSGLGDLTIMGGYEAVPDWDYNVYRPRVFIYGQMVLPTGRSRFESQVGGLDSRGNGLWAAGAGVVAFKAWGKWDAVAQCAAVRSFSRELKSGGPLRGRLEPGWGGSAGFGGGYNRGDWRFGGLLTWTYEDPIGIRGPTNISGSLERYATATLALTHRSQEDWTATLSYADQTWFGSPLNTSLGKTLTLVAERRWPR
jgi:hypothetical protein